MGSKIFEVLGAKDSFNAGVKVVGGLLAAGACNLIINHADQPDTKLHIIKSKFNDACEKINNCMPK